MVESQRAPVAVPPRGHRLRGVVGLVSLTAVLVLLYLLSRSNFLLFHSIVELFSVVIAFGIFVVAWNTRKWVANDYLLFLGIAYLFVATTDVFHLLAYRGMGVFPGFGSNEPTQFWILARYLEAFSLLVAPLFLARRLRVGPVAVAYALVTGFGLLSIVRLGIFPDCFVEGSGLTTFKIASEYVICAALAGGIVVLSRHRASFAPHVFRLLVGAMGMTVAAELSFTLYTDVYGVANMVGHLFKVVSVYLVYGAVIATSLGTPYATLFRDLARSKDQVQRERDLSRSYIDIAGAMLVVLDRDGKVQLVNLRGAEVLGYTEDEILGRDWFADFLPLAERDRVRGAFDALMTGQGEPVGSFENHVLTRDGGERLIVWRNTVLRDAQGAVTGTLGSGEDITEQRGAEKTLRQSEERFRVLFDRAPDAYYLSDLEGRFVDANAAAESLVGYCKDELLGQTFLESGLLSAEMAAQAAALVAVSATGEPTGPDGLTLTRKNGGQVVVEIRTELIESGGSHLVLGIAHDVTERKRAEEAVRVSGEKFRALFEQSIDAIYINAVDGTTVEANQAWLDMFGYSRDELPRINSGRDIYVDSRDRDDFLRRISRTGFVADEVRFKKKGGTVVHCQRTVVARRDASGAIVEFQGIIRDMTDRNRAEAEIRQLAAFPAENPNPVLRINESDVIVFANEASALVLQSLGVGIGQALPTEWQTRSKAARAGGSEVRAELACGERVFEIAVAPLKESGGANLYGLDVTETRAAERTLRESEEKYRSLFEQSRDAIVLTAPDGRVLDANPAFLRLFGYAPDEFAGLRMPELLADAPDINEFVTRLSRDGRIVDEECRFRRKDGSVMDCIRTIVVWRNQAGEVVAHQGLIRDITEQKRAEERLIRSKVELQELAARLDVAREEERAAVAWELHDEVAQALSVIKMDITTCAGRLPADSQSRIRQSLDATVGLLDATIARLRRLYMDLVPVMLEDLGLAAAIEWHTEQSREHSGTQVRVGHLENLELRDERTTLGLFRVMQEALKHVSSHPGVSTVTVALEREDGFAVLSIADDGYGFGDCESEPSCAPVLTGIRERARSWGGSVTVDSSPGKGTVLKVTAPLAGE